MTGISRLGWFAPVALCAALAVSSGCATGNVPFRGFGRVADDIDSPADPRGSTIPAFPLLYYKEQSHLAVLWPLYENEFGKSLALRPLFSAYNLNDPKTREWNVLWPLVHEEPGMGTGRAFPFFWGDDYLVGFPLWWHTRKAHGVEDLLIPLWWYERDALNWRFSALLGTVGFEHSKDAKGWRIFPLYGDYEFDNGARHRYELLLAHQYHSPGGLSHINTLIPLWWYDSDPSTWKFLTPLWMQGANRHGDSWSLLFPLFFYKGSEESTSFYTLLAGGSSSSNSSSWIVPPLLSGGSSRTDGYDNYFVWPLSHFGRDGESSSSHIFPLYYSSAGRGGSSFYSLPWWSETGKDGSNWQLLPPLFYRDEDQDSTQTYSPLYYARRGNRGELDSLTVALLGLYGSRRIESAQEKETWTYAFPLWGHSSKEIKGQSVTNSSAFLIALYDTKRGTTTGQQTDSVRRRILWEVMKYKREHNGDVEFGLLGFGYGSKLDGYRRYSFLHSLFRWQREPDGKRSLDLLFIRVL